MYGAQDPGNWQSFLKRQDNVGLPIMEAKSKYLMEQINFDNMMNFQSQNHVAGIPANPIVSIEFDSVELPTVTGFTSNITVTYTHPVSVSGGTPQLSVANNQLGGGLATVDYDYSSGTGTTALVFEFIQGPNTDGALSVGAGKLITGSSDLASVTQATVVNTLTGVDTGQTITGVSATYAAGGAGSEGQDVVCTVVITDAGVITSAEITSIDSSATAYFIPTDTLTIAFGELTGTNASGGSVVYTLLTAGLFADELISPQAYTMNGAEILTTSVSRPPAVELLKQAQVDAIAS
jgi:hypothetical protein